jgi:hypothetical protein
MTEYERQAERLEHEADEMEKRSDELGDEISDVREDWERKKQDDLVPGAQNPETGLPPEANYTTSGDTPPDAPGEGSGELPPPEPDETD